MRQVLFTLLVAGMMAVALPVAAQTPCPSLSVIVNTPEDELMLAINGAEKPEEQIAALDKFVKEHADSPFIPCVNEYYTTTYVKLNEFDKAIEYGEKDLAANYQDLNLFINLAKAYVGAGHASDGAFVVIMKAPGLIQAETKPSRPEKASDAEWEKMQADAANVAQQAAGNMEWAFFQLLPYVADASKRLALLDQFGKAYPDAAAKDAAQLNYQNFMAYTMLNQGEKADDYGEKVIAADPNNVEVLNRVAFDYATRRINLDKAEDYAKKVVTLVPTLKKPEGEEDDKFKTEQNNQLGMAHLSLGYIALQKADKTRRVGPAIEEFKAAVDLLSANPALQGGALYYLAWAYESGVPANHHAAAEALGKAVTIQSPWQEQAQVLLAKVKQAH